tara:strand:- start:654 stop:839 length:186 start_codon:yes stop_codon:yes gene_type:complete
MSKQKAIEIINNLEMTINKTTERIEKISSSIFHEPTASKQRLQKIQKKLLSEYNLTKKDLK